MARKFTQRLSFDELGQLSFAALRKEYTKMRDIFQKRIKRLSAAGSSRAEPYLPGSYNYFPTLKEFSKIRGLQGADEETMRRALLVEAQDLTNLIGTRTARGTISEDALALSSLKRKQKTVKNRTLQVLHNAGYEHIAATTLKAFGRFMDRMRAMYGRKLPNSEEMAEFFDNLKYNTKRRSTQFIVDLWREFEKNGYQSDDGNQDLFRPGDSI